MREATKNKQLGCRIPHIPSISKSYTQYARYVQIQYGITTKLYDSRYLFRRLRRVIHSKSYNHGSHDPTYRAYKQQKHNMSEYRQLQMKKAEKPDYLQGPPKGTRS